MAIDIQVQAEQERIQSFAFVIGTMACILFCTGFIALSLLRSGQSLEIVLNEKINPNEAPLGSLVRLPGIGVGKAAAIVAYREDLRGKNDDNPAFRDSDDLQKVKGIGPKTVQGISEWLKFE
jgi:competence ComEA-like helix-hairpin-helix protein